MRKGFFFLFICSASFAFNPPQNLLVNGKQLIVVTTPAWNSVAGVMRLFSRPTTHAAWKPVGAPIPIVVGKRGMGWDKLFKPDYEHGALKIPGDLRTPAGIYSVGAVFGFDRLSRHADYIPLDKYSVCVDDPRSRFFNRVIDSAGVRDKDWNSGEPMREVALYKLGAVIEYNSHPVSAEAGSCIFLHIWGGSRSGTEGCVGVDERELAGVLGWVDERESPVIVIFPEGVYERLKMKWGLPALSLRG